MKKLIIFCTMLGVTYAVNAAIKIQNNSYLTFPEGNVFTTTETISVSCWIKAIKPVHPLYVLAKSIDKTHSSFDFYSGVAKGLQFDVTVNNVKVASPDVGQRVWDNQWHFVVGIYDGNYVHIFVDNAEILNPTIATGSLSFTGSNFNIGCYDPNFYGGLYTGSIDDVRIFPVVLSADTMTQLFSTKQRLTTQENPIGWWKLNETPTGQDVGNYFFVDQVGDNDGYEIGKGSLGDDSILSDVFVSTMPLAQTVYILSQDDLNGVRARVWNDVFRKIVNLDDSFFVGAAVGNWAMDASSTTAQWVIVSQDTMTATACFLSTNTAHPSWNDYFRLNLVNALLDEAWDQITFPFTEFDSIEDAKKLSIFR